MEHKFRTPVAMKVTEEQFTRDLEEPLKALGYIKRGLSLGGYLVTQDCGINNEISFYSESRLFSKRHMIEEYNPDLFLAIAARTEDKIPIIGEWLIFKESEEVNSIFRVNEYGSLNDYTVGRVDKNNPNGSGSYIKATIGELTNHFSKPKETFVLPELWKLEVTEENVNAVSKWRSFLGYGSILAPHNCIDQSGFCTRMSRTSVSKIITTEQFMEHVYKPAFNEIPKEFYIHYCEGFTENIFNALYDWAKAHTPGKVRGHNDTYINFSSRNDKFWRFNFTRDPNGNFGYGVDNHNWSGEVKTEYTLEQVKELINYKSKTNKNECNKEEREVLQRAKDGLNKDEQIIENLDSDSTRVGGKEIKARVVSSRNLCERGFIESTDRIAKTRRGSSRLRASKGELHI